MKLHADHRTVFELQHGMLGRQVAYFERAEDAEAYARLINQANGEKAQDAASWWRPVETAPRDGTLILLYPTNGDGLISTGYRHLNDDHWSAGGGWFNDGEVSHWMPIPEAPEGASGEREVECKYDFEVRRKEVEQRIKDGAKRTSGRIV